VTQHTDRPGNGDRVRHAHTGDVGRLDRYERPDEWFEWALVRWDDAGPGMVDKRGLARVAPGLLEPLPS